MTARTTPNDWSESVIAARKALAAIEEAGSSGKRDVAAMHAQELLAQAAALFYEFAEGA